jgi:predicted Zn-dependent protease
VRRSLLLLTFLLAAACQGAPKRPAVAPPPPPPPPVVAVPAGPSPEVLLARARVLRAEGDLEGARARLETAVSSGTPSDELRLELAELLVADGRDLARARGLLDAVEARGGRLELLSAQLAELEGDDATAAAAYAVALGSEPDPDVRLRRALALERLGRGREALDELALVKRDRPDDLVVRARLAEQYEAAGLLAAAENELVEAARAAPDRPSGWDRLARFYTRIGRPEKARSAQARVRELSGAPERTLRPLLRSTR